MVPDDPRRGLGESRRYVYATGEATQLSTSLETHLSQLMSTLVHGRGEAAKEQKRLPPVSEVIKTCRGIIDDDQPLTGAELVWAQDALSAADDALQVRNRLVHDTWLGDSEDPTQMTRLKRIAGGRFGMVANFAEREASGLVEFEETVINLGRAIHRISALNLLISRRSMGLSLDDALIVALLSDNFDLIGIHAARPRGKAGE